MLAYFPVWRRNYLCNIKKEVFPLKHRICSLRATLAAALVLVILFVPALAAEITVDYTSEYRFSAADFSSSDGLEGIYISSVPPAYQAELCIGSRVICRGDILPAAALDNMKLRPVCLGNADCELVYCPIENGTLTDAVTVSLRILSGTNTAPVCEDGTLETYKNIANSGVLAAVDQEDQQLTYQLVKEPKRGTVELHEDGSFTYTPDKNKVGKDSFVYTATDPAGNVSNEACIKIRILKPADKATYQDMSGDRDAFAAMWLKDKGLYTGRIIAGNLCFEPDASVSRSEFLIACMKLAGLEQSDEAISTGFADELDTPRWQQPYLAAAYQSGMISGTPTEEGLVFRPEEDLSRAEAAVMLQKLLRLPGVGRKTANLLLGDIYRTPGSVVCDTHCIRICNLLGLASGKNPAKVEQQLRAILPPEESSDFCHRLVLHGRAVCVARKPACERCCLAPYCKSFTGE